MPIRLEKPSQRYLSGNIRLVSLNNAVAPVVEGLPLRDGPSNVHVPRNSQDWLSLGLPAPLIQWDCQEDSGDLFSSIGTATLAAGGSGHLYRQSITGWTRRFVGLTDSSTHRWHDARPK